MLDNILKFGFMLAIVFFTYSAGVAVNMFDVWPNGIYMKALDSVEGDTLKKKRRHRKH